MEEKVYGIMINISDDNIMIVWGGAVPASSKPLSGQYKKSIALEVKLTKIFHKVINKGKRELLEIFEKNDFEMLGNLLFKILCCEDAVKTFLYDQLSIVSRDRNARCRIYLDFDENAFDMAALPWEYLQIDRNAEKRIVPFFWSAGFDDAEKLSKYDLIRYVSSVEYKPEEPAEHEIADKLNVILVVNSPDNNPLDKGDLIDKLKELNAANKKFEFHYDEKLLYNPPFDDLRNRIGQYVKKIKGPYVLHFLGHAQMKKDQYCDMVFTDRGTAKTIDSVDFANLFNPVQQGDFRLPAIVLLQACESGLVGDKGKGIGYSVASKGIPAVVAMQNEVMPTSSTAFVMEFYKSLLDGEDVARAVTRGRTFMAFRYNKKQGEPREPYSDNTFGSAVIFLSSAVPFALTVPEADKIPVTQAANKTEVEVEKPLSADKVDNPVAANITTSWQADTGNDDTIAKDKINNGGAQVERIQEVPQRAVNKNTSGR